MPYDFLMHDLNCLYRVTEISYQCIEFIKIRIKIHVKWYHIYAVLYSLYFNINIIFVTRIKQSV